MQPLRLLRGGLFVTLALAAATALPRDVAAQTGRFGKNKIQYNDFDWRVLQGEHVDVYYYPEEESLARLALEYAEESYDVLERRFQHHPYGRIPLIVYSSHQHFEQTNVSPGFIPEGVLGFTEYLKRRVALPFEGDYAQFKHTLRHELVHAFQISKLAQVDAALARKSGTSPQNIHWWTEGLAEYWSSEQDTQDEMYVRDLVLNGRLPTISQFSHMYSYASYPLGAELHHYLSQRFGEEYILRMYEEYWKYGSFDQALAGVLDVDLDQLSREFRYWLEQRFFPQYGERPPLEIGSQVLVEKGGANFKPTPYRAPGDTTTQLFFLSPRTGYTDIYRTTVGAGEAGVHAVVKGERSPEFESFHAYDSDIDVSPAGVLAFVSKYQERDALFLWDVTEGKVVGRYQWDDIVGIKSPSWSPDGHAVVFEGLTSAGFSDLWTIDFDTQQLRRLTHDRYRDQDPDWSPDGSTIAFASDRTSPYGREGYHNLFLLDVATGAVRPLTYGRWKDESPAWSHDGRRIAFSSDRSGTFDLYAVDTDGLGRRLTQMTGGAFDPDWLPGDSSLVFAGFSEGRFRIYRAPLPPDTARLPAVALALPAAAPPLNAVPDTAAPVADTAGLALAAPGAPAESARADTALAAPPLGAPVDSARADTALAAAVAPADTGAHVPAMPTGWRWVELDSAAVDTIRSESYNTWKRFSVDFAGAEGLVAPGLGSAQGAQVVLSDMLGDHIIYVGLSALQSRIQDLISSFSGQVVYMDLSNRLNYGAGLFRYAGRFRDVAYNIFDERSYGASLVASYPYSKFRRVEFQGSLEHSERTDVLDACQEGLLCPTKRRDPRDLTRTGTMATTTVSLIKDNTLWLPTGPIDGSRYNLTAGVTTCFACRRPGPDSTMVNRGTLLEHFVLAVDLRRYFRVTLQSAYAVRLFGYYSDGAIPGRSILGGPDRLRGYPLFSLAGSRVWLLNQEFRFPLLDSWTLDFPFGALRFPGIQGAAFGDVGSSWLEGDSFEDAWGSYGFGLRTSVGPGFVLRFDVGKRFALGAEPPVVYGGRSRFGDTFAQFYFGFDY